ncbi:recombination mediator protein UvsY [Escherichia coli]|uniref:recombination mediator protein UvsY n=1 Tax=Escherichia coli TaxID=562 RepID=UPI003A5C2928
MIPYSASELKVVMTADDEILPLDTKIAYYQMVMDFAGKALDIVKSRGFAIKNAIELRMLESGR